jgi:cell division protein FtsQ
MKIVIKIILLIGVLGYLIFGIARLSGDEDKRICSGVEIIIKDSIKPNFIDKSFVKELVLQTQTQIEGTAIKDINIKFIEEFIQESPYIDSTICYYTPDNLMCIAVFPRQPVLHVMSDAGENYYMDINGNQMPTDRFHLDLCLATGDITREYAHEKLVGIAEYINTHKPWNTEIQQIYVKNPKHLEFIPLTGEHVIVIGEPTDIEEKLNRLRIFYEEGLNKAGWNKYSIIDLNYADQVVCTKKKKI